MFRVLSVVLMFLAPTFAAAQCVGQSFWDTMTGSQQADLRARAADMPYSQGNLWRATKGDVTLTVLGTLHLPDPRHANTMRTIAEDLDAADLLLVEATLEDQTAMQVFMAQNADLMTLTDGTTLPERLEPEIWDALSEAATARGIPSFMAAKMQPWFLSMTLSIPPCASASMMAGETGLDGMIMARAADLNLPAEPLEPWQDMFALISSGTMEEQIEALAFGVIAPSLQDAMVVSLSDFYFEGQTAMGWYMSEYMVEYLPPAAAEAFPAQMEELEKVLLNDRNANWIPVIEDAATRADNIFIAFGAAHLFGDLGVLNLLAQQGWTVSPL